MSLSGALNTLYALDLALGCLLVVLARAFFRVRSPLTKLPYPPGPPAAGILSRGKSEASVQPPWLAYIELGNKYGNILDLRAYNKHTIILNTYEDCKELLEKRALIYSDRPYLPVIDLMGWLSINVGFIGYGAEWRSHRRIFQKCFKPDVAVKYRAAQSRKVHDCLYALLTTPDEFINHYRTLASAIIMSIMYAHDVGPKNDYFVDLADRAVGQLSENTPPGASLLYLFPILRYIPSWKWFPGGELKRFVLESRRTTFKLRDIPIGIVEKQMKEGILPDCVAAELLQSSPEDYKVIVGAAATSYAAGADTTTSSVGTFFYAMAIFPEVQRRAQKEIDAVVGCDRLITYDDLPSLPYIQAVQREVMRWRPVLPLSVFHATSSDDVYKGYYIPKGATVISNTWAIAHDPKRYPKPDEFNPGRFFGTNGELNDDDVGYVFGFGRRLCPGRHLASASVWLAIATILQTFDIRKKRNARGEEIPISGEYRSGLLIQPLPFECSITPRSAATRNIILEAVEKSG